MAKLAFALVEQHLLGVPAQQVQKQVSPDDQQLKDWWAEYEHQFKTISDLSTRYPEMMLSILIDGHSLVAKFDVIAIDEQQNLIAIDWKTGKLPPSVQLEKRMQTLVYLAVLYRAAKALTGQQPQSITLRYISLETGEVQSFNVTALNIAGIEAQIVDVIEAIGASSFEKVADERPCRYCVYRGLCGRGTTQLEQAIDLPTLAENGELFDWFNDADSQTVEF